MASSFKDLTGREWTISLNAPLLKRIKEVLGIGLTDLDSDPFHRLSINPILLVDTLWLLVEKQAKAAGITDEQFGESLGDQIDEAVTALVVAVTDFFPASRRSLLRSMLAKSQEMQSKVGMTTLTENQEMIEQKMTKRMKRELSKFLDDTDSGTSEENGSAISSTGSTQ